MTTRSHQSQQEYAAGYRHGLSGGDRPGSDKGAAYFGGCLAGIADRKDQQSTAAKAA